MATAEEEREAIARWLQTNAPLDYLTRNPFPGTESVTAWIARQILEGAHRSTSAKDEP